MLTQKDFPKRGMEQFNTRSVTFLCFSSLQSLFAAIVTRMRRCVSDDVYVPLYPRR